MTTVYTIGEALIDFIPAQKGVPLKDVESFDRAAGGAPANVACAIARLGGASSFVGMVGADAFGQFLIDTLEDCGVNCRYLFQTREANTSLAFVSLQQDGNRDFSFYRSPGADMLLREEQVAAIAFQAGDILHYGSVDLIEAPVKYAHKKAIEAAANQQGIVSFDPNVRLPLWPDAETCRQTILEFLPYSHIIKISDEELFFITGIEDEQQALGALFTGSVQHVLYTKGSQGAEWHSRSGQTLACPAPKVQAIDTTGAGDAFMGAILYQLQQRRLPPADWSPAVVNDLLRFANQTAALATTRKGAISSFPSIDEVLACLNM